jgi:hypothetical protein
VVDQRDFKGNAAATRLASGINAAATSFTITGSGSGYPDGSGGLFVITLDRGLSAEEKVLCSARSGAAFTVSLRGWDDTSAASHSSNATVEHTLSAVDLREANAAAIRVTAGLNVRIDGDEIQAVNNGVAARLILQNDGPGVTLGSTADLAAPAMRAVMNETPDEVLTTSTSFGALIGTPVAICTAPTSGQVRVTVSAVISNSSATQSSWMSADVIQSGSVVTGFGAAQFRSAMVTGDKATASQKSWVVTGLTAGFMVSGGTGHFLYEAIIIEPLP